METKILFQSSNHYVVLERTGRVMSYIVYKNSGTHAVKVATIGESYGIGRAIAECERREQLVKA